MYVYMCMYVCMYVCVRMYVCMCVWMYYVCVCTYVCVYMYVCVCMCVGMYVCMYVCLYICVYVCVYMYVCVCIITIIIINYIQLHSPSTDKLKTLPTLSKSNLTPKFRTFAMFVTFHVTFVVLSKVYSLRSITQPDLIFIVASLH